MYKVVAFLVGRVEGRVPWDEGGGEEGQQGCLRRQKQ